MDDKVFDFDYALSLLPLLARGFLVTLEATGLGILVAMVLGLFLALARRHHAWWLSRPTSFFVELVRSTPLLVQLYFLFFVLPSLGVVLSPMTTGVLALGMHYAAYTSEVYRAGIDAVPPGQWDAAYVLRLSRARTLTSIILPQAIPPMLPALGNYTIAMFKDTPLLSAITVVEVVQTAQIAGSRSFRYLEAFTLVGLLFLLASLVAGQAVRTMERRLAAPND